MTRHHVHAAALCATAAALMLTGCGGGKAGGPALPPQPAATAPPTTSPVSGAKANAVLVITIPPKTSTSSASRNPSYVSPSTQSITVQVDTGTPATQNLTPGSPNCNVPAPLAPLTCTVPIVALPGSHTFTFITYDQTGGAGNKLSTNSLTQTLVANQVDNISVTLAGVPAAVSVAPIYNAVGISGDQSSGFSYFFGVPQTISVTAVDADGNYIVGPGAPALSVSVTGASAGSGIAVAAAANGNPNDFTLQSASVGTGTLAITATPASGSAGSPLSANVQLTTMTNTTTVAGVTNGGLSNAMLDGTGSGARFWWPEGIAYDSADGNLYITESGSCLVRRMTQAGVVNTIAGAYAANGTPNCGFANGSGTSALFKNPSAIAYDSTDGNLYVTDFNNCQIRRVSTAGVVTTLAGSTSCGTADGSGGTAQFNYPVGIAYDSADGNLYVSDTYNCEIRKITPGGLVTTIAGNLCTGGSSDGTGRLAQFGYPQGIAYDAANGNLYVMDTQNSAVRQVTTSGVVTTIARGLGTADGIAYDSNDGNLYVTATPSNLILQVTPSGTVTTVSGIASVCPPNGSCDGLSNIAKYYQPSGLVFDPATDSLYITDTYDSSIRQVQL